MNKDISWICDESNEEYHANTTHVSKSGLSKFLISPFHYYQYYLAKDPLKDDEEDSRSKIIGQRFHQMLLEPDKYKQNYIVERLNWSTVAGRKQKQEWQELKEKGISIIPQDEHEEILEMFMSFNRLEKAWFLSQNGINESSLYWYDDTTGVGLKCRPDVLHKDRNIICEIKTTKNAAFKPFYYEMRNFNYHLQAAMMIEGYEKVLGKVIENFYFLCIENKKPYACAIYQLSQETLNEGKMLLHSTLPYFKECKDNDVWPTYDEREI